MTPPSSATTSPSSIRSSTARSRDATPPASSPDEAFGALVGACCDGTWVGSRDQLAIRLGLTGLRSAEVARLTWGCILPDGSIQVAGKGHKVRTIIPGPTLMELLARWRRQYEKQLGRPVSHSDPILCREVLGTHGRRRPNWGQSLAPRTFSAIVQQRAKRAGLGHVAPHDLRRTAAAILHRAKTADGGHLFDLLDIQQVLDHAATTQRSYLDQLDTETKEHAGRVLD